MDDILEKIKEFTEVKLSQEEKNVLEMSLNKISDKPSFEDIYKAWLGVEGGMNQKPDKEFQERRKKKMQFIE